MTFCPQDEIKYAYNSFTIYSFTFHPESDTDEEGEATYVLSVALRQRQIPSRLRKFLCLKPGSSFSQTYWTKER